MAVILIGIATFFSTLFGGLFALRLRDQLHLILGFSAGAVIGVAFFDLLPEAMNLGGGMYGLPVVSSIVALGFLLYLCVDRLALLHGHSDEEAAHDIHRGIFGAGTLALHSLLDGLTIGFAFQVSSAVGVVVALAVLAHDFSDGINTVNMVLKNNGERSVARRWLLVDAIAPVVGIALAQLVSVPGSELGLLLGAFAGFFIYIGASDLIPESHHQHPTVLTTIMTVLGAAVLYGVIQLANM